MNYNYNWNNTAAPVSYSQNPYPYNNYMNRFNQEQQQQSYPNNTKMNSNQNNIVWVKGKENARSMQLPPNSTMIYRSKDMLNIEEVHEAIRNLEQNCPTTYSNCSKLASLYIIRQFYDKSDHFQDDGLRSMEVYNDNLLDLNIK